MVSRKDRLGALTLGTLVLVYAIVSMPSGMPATYLARVDSMEKRKLTPYQSNYNNNYPLSESTRSYAPATPRSKRIASNYHPQKANSSDRYRPRYTPGYSPRPTTAEGRTARTSVEKPYQRTNKAISLNESDSVSLEKLPGIGPVLASRIIRYREKLGGFYHRSQLREVYGIDDSLYAFLEPLIETGAEDRLLKKIDLNTATLETLRQHPYLRWEKAKAIIRYREANGPFGSARDLEKILALDSVTITRLLPYVQVNPVTRQAP
jgi:DNA uptake protein ComE-like DNA-binding protein